MAIEKKHKLIVNIMGICLLVVFVVLLFQMARIQLFDHEKYARLATSQQVETITIPARRGPILDRNGNKLADSIRVNSVFADPLRIKDKHLAALKLAETLDCDQAEILRLLNKKKRFVWIKRKISNIEEIGIDRLKLKGVYTKYEYDRLYPNGELSSHVIGITDIDGIGIEGAELSFNDLLKGEDGYLVVEKDGLQRQITNINSVGIQPADGSGVMLTIDSVIQQYVENEIEEVFQKRKPRAVIAVVMETSTGEILAMANRPTFNPNHFSEYPASFRRNRSITDCYEPGSIMKPLIVGALLNNSLVSPEDEIFCHNGTYRMNNGRVLHDSHGYGNLTVSDIVVKSSNIGMAQLATKIDELKLYKYLTDMKFGCKFNLRMPGEIAGILRPASSWTSYTVPSIAMGHEIAVTPLQFVNAFAAIANGGNLLKPTIFKAITTNDGKTILKKVKTPVLIKRVMSPDVARNKLNPILVKVIDEGTGKRAKLDSYKVAGKTGTAQKQDAKGYSQTKYLGSFVAYAPANAPEICVIVMVDEPKGEYYGGTVAAPVVKNIIKKTLDYRNGFAPASQQILASLSEN